MRSVTRRREDRSESIIHGEFSVMMDGNEFMLGVTRTPEGMYKEHNTLESLYAILVSIPDISWLTISEHDFNFTYFVPHLMKWIKEEGHSVHPIPSGEDIIGLILKWKIKHITYKKGKRKEQVIDKVSVHTERIIIRDAIHHFREGLDNAVQAFAPDVLRSSDNENVRNLLMYETNALHQAYDGFDQTVKEYLNVRPGWTSGGTAIKAWMNTIPKGYAYYRVHSDKEKFIRKSYYGGFTFPGQTTMIYLNAVRIDRRAAFAATMREGVPYGRATWTEWFVPEKPGYYEVYAESPGTNWPLVPYRSKYGLHWTNQSCITYLSDLEITWYMHRGWHFYVLDGIFFRETEFPFNAFIDKCERFEYPHGKPAPLAVKYAVKPMRTNLYGRMGMNTEQEQLIIIHNPPADEGYTMLINMYTGDVIEDVFQHSANIDASYINPHWAAYITARQRLHLFDVMEMVGVENVYYADTDCVVSDRDHIKNALKKLPTDNGYGSWRIDADYAWLKVNAPKDYYGEYTSEWAREHELKERRVSKAKSIPQEILKEHPEYQQTHEQFDINTRTSFTNALMNQDDPIILTQKRSSSTLASSVAWSETSDHSIIPTVMKSRYKVIDGIPAIPTAKDGIKWLSDLGYSYSEVAKLVHISVNTIKSIMSRRRSGKDILERLQEVVEEIATTKQRKEVVVA